jgi:hypothetical protein
MTVQGQPPQNQLPPGNRLRDVTTAVVAAVVIAGFVALITATALLVGNNTEFSNMKDLLAFVNPLAGVVVGFYFTKAAVEPRAEEAETAARTARDDATAAQVVAAGAQEARGNAERDADRARQQAREATVAAETVAEAADQVLQASAARPETLGGGGVPPAAPSLDGLRAAVAVARRLTADADG